MARYWRAFETQEERKQWEKEQKKNDDTFVVCFHYSARDLEKELYMPKGSLEPNKYVTVYGYKGNI